MISFKRCERVKCDFADDDFVSISMNKYDSIGSVRTVLEYEYFSLLLENDIKRVLSCLEDAVEIAGLNSITLDRILCVGGSSNLRPFREKIEERFGEDLIYYPDRVMWDIAKGAA